MLISCTQTAKTIKSYNIYFIQYLICNCTEGEILLAMFLLHFFLPFDPHVETGGG